MSFSDHARITTANNEALRKKISYIRSRSDEIRISKRTGIPMRKRGTNKNNYRLTKERKALMFKKGALIVGLFCLFFALIASLTIYLMS